jgi:hypothetical protein
VGTTSPSSGAQRSRSDNERAVREPKNDHARAVVDRQAKPDAKPEKRNFFLFWRHPRKDKDGEPALKAGAKPPVRCKKGEDCSTKPVLEAKAQPPKRCKVGEVCPVVCAQGQINENGKCVAPPPVTDQCLQNGYTSADCRDNTNRCPVGTYWNGLSCAAIGDSCASNGQVALLAHQLRMIEAQMQVACSSDPSGPKCISLKEQYESALLRYRMVLSSCR